MTGSISCADIAKMIRKELKKRLPETRFSVKAFVYNSIMVSWTDGPTSLEVEGVIKHFRRSLFHSPIHSTEHEGHQMCFGESMILCSRQYTRIFLESIVQQFCKRFGENSENILLTGSREQAWVSVTLPPLLEHHLKELFYKTHGKDRMRVYEAQEAQIHQEYVWLKAEEKKHTSRNTQGEQTSYNQEQQEAFQQAEQRKREQVDHDKVEQCRILASREAALWYFDLSPMAETHAIMKAFWKKVRQCSDEKGGYTMDMHFLVQAKDRALAS